MIIVADFTQPEVLSTIIKEISEAQIDVGVLVNNVGINLPYPKPFVESDQDFVKNIIYVNVLAATVLCHALLPNMKKKGKGAIINISSAAGHMILPYLAEYCGTKHYLSAFTQAIAAEYSDSGVTVQLIEPGMVETAMTRNMSRGVG